MEIYRNECSGCACAAYPCIDCGAKRVRYTVCDRCEESTKLYYYEGQELCMDCITEILEEELEVAYDGRD